MTAEKDIWDKAPVGATHYTPKGMFVEQTYWKIEDGVVLNLWVDTEESPHSDWYLDQGFFRLDYRGDQKPAVDVTEMIKRPDSTAWTPSIGDKVLYQNAVSLDHAWDEPEEAVVVAIHEGMYGLLGDCGYVWAPLRHLSPLPTTPSLYGMFEEQMLDILLDGWQTSPSRAKALCEVLYEKGLRFTDVVEVV